MRIGVAGPMTLELLRPFLPASSVLPEGYPFPMTALLVGELLQRGHQVVAYTTSRDLREAACYTSAAGLTLCIAPSRPHHRAKTLFRDEIAALRQAMHDHPCDLVHAHWTYEFAMAALSSGLPSLVTVHDSARAILLQLRDAYRLVRWGMNAYTVRRAPHLSAVSPYLAGTLPASARAKTTVIPNFVTESLFAKGAPLTRRGRYIITVCNGFSRVKNLQNGLMGFREALSKVKDMRLLLVGVDCQPGGPAQRFCDAAGCGENVEFAGPVSYDRVMDLAGNAMAMLHPSYEESFGMSVVEAMALGTPVIAGARSGNMPHLIEDGRTGILCDVARPASIAAALCTLCNDDSLRERISRDAREHARLNYSASIVIDRYLSQYRRILTGVSSVPGSADAQRPCAAPVATQDRVEVQ